jgi:hypothetical protein
MQALVEAGIFTICAAARKLLTPEEIAALPPAPEIPGEGRVCADGVITWSAFLLWPSLRDGDLLHSITVVAGFPPSHLQ